MVRVRSTGPTNTLSPGRVRWSTTDTTLWISSATAAAVIPRPMGRVRPSCTTVADEESNGRSVKASKVKRPMWCGATTARPPRTIVRAIGAASERARRLSGTAMAMTATATVKVPTNLRWLGLGRCRAIGTRATAMAAIVENLVRPGPLQRRATTTSATVATISSQKRAAIWAGRSSPGRRSGPLSRSSRRAKKSPLSDGSGGRGRFRPARNLKIGSMTMPSSIDRGPTSTRCRRNGERPATSPVMSRLRRCASAIRMAGRTTTRTAGPSTSWWKTARPQRAAPIEARRPSSPSSTRAAPATSRPSPAIHG